MAIEQEESLRLDLEELRHLESIAKRPRVLSLLSFEARNLDEKLSKTVGEAAAAAAVEAPKQASSPLSVEKKSPAAAALHYATLSSFSWDQDNDKIKIYVLLEGVKQENVDTIFKPLSIDVKLHDVQGKNYRCAIPKLNKEIVPDICKVQVKPNKVIITLPKASKGNWSDLHFKEDKVKVPNLSKEKDPMAGLMNMMKDMYEDGDEDMKRLIAKAYTDSRSGKFAGSLGGFPDPPSVDR